MTNTTDKFIDLLNESIFKAIGLNTRIEKVPSLENKNPIVIPGFTQQNPTLKSDSVDTAPRPTNTTAQQDTTTANTATATDSPTAPTTADSAPTDTAPMRKHIPTSAPATTTPTTPVE
jgi:hypothetical protein